MHLVEVQPHTGQTPTDAYRSIRRELEAYSRALADKEELLVMTKADLLGGDGAPRRELAEAVGRSVLLISAATGQGLKELVAAILDLLDRVGEPAEREKG